jgi:hypothetical protein
MVLLENFGAEPLTVKFNRPNRYDFLLLLPQNVVQTMILRIPKLRKENYPERAKNGGNQLFDGFSILTFLPVRPSEASPYLPAVERGGELRTLLSAFFRLRLWAGEGDLEDFIHVLDGEKS